MEGVLWSCEMAEADGHVKKLDDYSCIHIKKQVFDIFVVENY